LVHSHRKKYEIATDEPGNPIKQDTKKGVLREVSPILLFLNNFVLYFLESNLILTDVSIFCIPVTQFKKGDIFFNYGCFPQTWEDPTFIHPDADGCRGDNDPLDVCEIGARIVLPGDIRAVKVLGIICMIDEGECDWKVVVIDAADKWAPFINDINDVEEQLPGMLSAIREWYRTYKIPDGKPPNVFGLDERFMDKEYAMQVIDECHVAWEELISGEKHRSLENCGDDKVADLVRNLSRNSLFTLSHNLDEHVEAHGDDFGEPDSGAVFF
jgi:inorganic pyrophosphatase